MRYASRHPHCEHMTIEINDKRRKEQLQEKAKVLEAGFYEIKKEAKEFDFSNKTVSAITGLDNEKNLAACIYKGEPFLGIQDKKTHRITLERREKSLEKISVADLDGLIRELKVAQINLKETGEIGERSKELTPSWEPLYPVMDKIIAYEKKIERLPETKRNILQKSGLYDQKINDIVSAGEKEMDPLTEQAWEEFYGVDINKSGKRNIEGPMSTLEQDIMEKTYHKDFDTEGFVDEDWHIEKHIEPVKTEPLRERLERAKEEALHINSSKKKPVPVVQKKEKTDELELTKYNF